MYYTIIRFPFQSINDEQYYLTLALNSSTDMSDLVDFLDKTEREFFKRGLDTISGADTIYNFEGTLTGSVRAVDGERENIFAPLVCSKLSFNMAVENFPTWLLPYCESRRAKILLHYTEGGVINHEMWRGYLIDQTLNLTVVYDKLSVPLVAVDEVDMAKYLNFKESLDYVTNDRWCSIFGLMEHYHDLHYTIGLEPGAVGFEKLYQIVGLSSTNRMLWHRNLRIMDDDGDPVNDIPSTMFVNLDRWIQDAEATWEDVFNELFEYLGVTFAIGSYGLMTVNDAYLLTCPTDVATVQQFVYTFNNHSIITHSNDVYATLANPTKYGANLQVTAEPDKYKEVKVTSEPERWETHEYLTDEHYKEIVQGAQVKYSWGSTEDPDYGPFDSYGWYKMKYIKPDNDEGDYLTIGPCVDGEGYLMARNGELPYDDLDSCTGLTEPDASCVNSLDFITFKEGCCCIKIGSGEISGIDEDKNLDSYFLIMNHMWGTMVGATNHTMSAGEHIADTPWLKLRPLGLNGAVHPSEKHYLKIEMDVKFIRENFPVGSSSDGNPLAHNWFASPGAGHSMQAVTWQSPAMILPCVDTVFDFETTAGPYHGAYNGGIVAWNSLYFVAYIHIGRYYYNGSSWVYVASGETPPKCNVIMKNSTTEVTEIDRFGIFSLHTKNYFYTISNPCSGNMSVGRLNDYAMMADMNGISIHGQPVHGQLEMEVLGQIRFQSTNGNGYGQSIPFLLINKIKINYTDDSEVMDADIVNESTMIMDAASTSKETMEKELAMATPSVAGFFNNALVYDGGKAWHNVRDVYPQTSETATTLEWEKARALANQYSAGQVFVEFETPVAYDDNVHNVGFRVTGLTEVEGRFLPVRRDFDYTRETMRVKLMRVNALPSD